jgi:hypothetical protein
VVYRAFPAETVVLNLNTGQYHGLNPTGGRMLETLESAGTIREAAERLAGEFDVARERLETDMLAFCRDLAGRDLIEIGPVT